MSYWYGEPDRDFYTMRATAQMLSNLGGLYNKASENKENSACIAIQNRIHLECACAMFFELDCYPIYNIYTGLIRVMRVHNLKTDEVIDIYPTPPKHPETLDKFRTGAVS